VKAETLRSWARRDEFALGMSSGFFGFFAHAGFLSVLEEEGLHPSRVAGSSAGGLVTGAWASGISASELADELLALRREDFWDPALGVGLLRGRLFRRRLESLLPARSFAECRVPFGVSVWDVLARKTLVVDEGPLAPAIHATCAVPLMFQPVWLNSRPTLDGGIADRHGLASLGDTPRVLYHHLASRSPWRRPESPALRVPSRTGLVGVRLEGLPRVNPYRLERGREAFERARAATRKALDEPVAGTVSIPA